MGKYVVFLLGIIIFSNNCYAATYNTPVIDGDISVTPADWDLDENIGEPGVFGDNPDWSMWMTWDLDYVYIGFIGPSLYPSNNDRISVYVDARVGGAETGLYSETLNMTADFCLVLQQNDESSGYHTYNAGWGTMTNFITGTVDPDLEWDQSADHVELRVSWSTLTNNESSGPLSFNIHAFNTTRNETINAYWPADCVWTVSGEVGDCYVEIQDNCEPQDGGLPVVLTTFTVLYVSEIAELQWTTASETNNMGWNIYRSASQNIGQALQINFGLIPGAGNSSIPTQYQFVDEGLAEYIEFYDLDQNSTINYWIESIDYAGSAELHGPVAIYIPEAEVDPGVPDIPISYGLQQNYPNPFNPWTTIQFNLDQADKLDLSVYNLRGQLVKNIFAGYLPASEDNIPYSFNWDGRNATGQEVPSGIYLYRLKTSRETQIKRMILTK
jgi:flagellar hook capping protein FlgD